jgi:hypothetical protein
MHFSPDPHRTVCHFQNFTEQEVAQYLAGIGINDLRNRKEKVAFAVHEMKPWIAELWRHSKDEGQPEYRQDGARWLARRMESLDGLTAIVKLAEVL